MDTDFCREEAQKAQDGGDAESKDARSGAEYGRNSRNVRCFVSSRLHKEFLKS